MSQKYLIRIAELERLLSEQAEALRQKDQQLSLVEETEAFLRSALARAEEKIEEEEREIEYLRAQIEKLRRMLFGTRSEKLQREVEQAEALLKQREQESDRYSGREDDPLVPRQLRQSRHRRPLPAHLPREIYRLEPEESCCPECGGELDYLGEVSAEQLELVSSALKVIRTERVKKACTKCDCIPASCDSHVIVVRYQHIFPVKYTAWSLKKVVARSVAVSWIIWVKSVLSSWNW